VPRDVFPVSFSRCLVALKEGRASFLYASGKVGDVFKLYGAIPECDGETVKIHLHGQQNR